MRVIEARMWRQLLVGLALVYVGVLKHQCLLAKRARAEQVLQESARVRWHLADCPIDDPNCHIAADMRMHAPGEDGGVGSFAGHETWLCALLGCLPSLPGVSASSVGDRMMEIVSPISDEAPWFREQCQCWWVNALPAWIQPSPTRANHRHVRRIGEMVTGVSADEVVRRARESPLFFGVRGEQFLRWVEEAPDASVFYNEAFARVVEQKRIGVVARNVWAFKRAAGLFGSASFSIVMNEYEYSTWSAGCDCVPDDRSLSWATHTASDDLRLHTPLAASANASLLA